MKESINNKWSTELFTVSERFRRQAINLYKLTSLSNEQIVGTFYETELLGYSSDISQKLFEIEKIIKRKGNKILVKWKSYPISQASWIDKNTVQEILM